MPSDILPPLDDLRALAPTFAASAQRIYDEWEQDENGVDPELGSGGICHLVADAIVADVAAVFGEARIATKLLSDVQHVNVAVATREGVHEIDIPYWLYERGAMFTWTKLPDVRFSREDVDFFLLDPDPASLWRYLEDGEPDPELEEAALTLACPRI